MTREEAIEILRHNTNLGYGIVIENEDTKLICDALDMAIKALKQEPCDCSTCVNKDEVDGNNCYECVKGIQNNYEQKESCEDAISRQAVLDAMYKLCGEGTLENNQWRDNPHIDAIIDAIDNIQTVTPKPKMGNWIPVYQGDEIIKYRCSECGFEIIRRLCVCRRNFCCSCGVKMEVE